MIDEAFEALLARNRAAEVDARYAAYDAHPLDGHDGWGDLASFRGGSCLVSLPERGEVWWCELVDVGRRPVVVLSRDAAIPRLRRTLPAPCTTNSRGLRSEVILEPADDPVPGRAAVTRDSVESVSVGVPVERLGRLADARMGGICVAVEVAVDSRG